MRIGKEHHHHTTGVADPAIITSNNAQTITTDALIIALVVNALKFPPTAIITSRTGSVSGDCGGELAYSLNISSQSGNFTGNFIFNSYCANEITINGPSAVNGIYILSSDEFEILNMNLNNISSGDYILNGLVEIDYRRYPKKIEIFADVYNKKISTGKTYWANDYTINIRKSGASNKLDLVARYNDPELVGRYYDPDYGYVAVTTPAPLVFDFNAEWPREGEMLCSGALSVFKFNSSSILTVLDDISYKIDADRDGDGIYEYNIGPFLWSDL